MKIIVTEKISDKGVDVYKRQLEQLSDSCAYCKILGNYPADGR